MEWEFPIPRSLSGGQIAGLLGAALVTRFIVKAIYNIFFHPLRHYPGPLLWRATSIPRKLYSIRGRYYLRGVEFHEKYGDVVRVAPNELSYTHSDGWKEVNGRPHKNENPRNPRLFPRGMTDGGSLFVSNAVDHTRQRRLFTHAFSNSALVAQEPLLAKYADQMVDLMDETQKRDGKVNIVDCLNFATFDVMADLTFGEPLHLLEGGEYTPWVKNVFAGLKFAMIRMVLVDIPILGFFLEKVAMKPLAKKAQKHNDYAQSLLAKRLAAAEDGKPDIWSFVLRHSEDGKGLTPREMEQNSVMFMTAGTETTATTLSGLLYYLTRTPDVYKKLTDEIRSTFKSSEDISVKPLSEMTYFLATLREGLRIYAPGGGGAGRVAPPGGTEIAGRYVPEGTVVVFNAYAAFHAPKFWHRAYELRPERWLEKESEEWANDRRELHEPFSVGPRNCIGKNLAQLEMRMLLAKILWHYDVELCPESRNWVNQRSFLTWEKGPMYMVLKPVKR